MPFSLIPPCPPAAPTPYPGDVRGRDGVRSAGHELTRVLLAGGGPPLVLDLSGVDRPTAAGLGELVALHRRLRDSGGDLVLYNVSDRTFEAVAVSGLIDLLEVRRPGGA